MNDKDIADWGREIGDRIEKFVNSKEVKELQDNIKVTVENTMEEVGRSVKQATEYMNKNVEVYWNEPKPQTQSKPKQDKPKQDKPKQDKLQMANSPGDNRKQTSVCVNRKLPIVKKPRGRVSGVLMTVFGTIGAVISGTSALFGYSLTLLTGGLVGLAAASMGFPLVVGGVCVLVAVLGGYLRRRAKRFRSYVKTMGNKDFYSVEGLAKAVQKNEKYVVKDLKRMTRKGWFKEGHLDEQETCFMLTDEAYRLYLEAQKELERRKEEEELLAREQEIMERDPARKQLRTAIEEGKEYIRRIREINDDMPQEDISNKLSRLEKVCVRIFEHVEDNPDKLQDIRKFMNYYLPTTLKLTETYYEFSIQPVQGENILTAKKEIEEMLDDINGAFEKMFDKLFANDAMDISTDISALSAMLAQEGLLENEFQMKNES